MNLEKTLDQLSKHIPENVINELRVIAPRFGITNRNRLLHFLAQCAHESGNFKHVEENLNYSASRLLTVFPKYFTSSLAAEYQRKPQRIASRVYANRMGNGNEESRDGWKYRGRGYLQLTGKNNYSRFGQFLKIDLLNRPDLVATTYPLTSAAFFFAANHIWTYADRGISRNDVITVTRRVNGGLNGLEDRIRYLNTYLSSIKD